jgi:iodotyrosine deiodinase
MTHSEDKFISYTGKVYSEAETLERSADFRELMDKRRTVRDFSDKPIPKGVIENIVMTASSAPSGANKQPWTFCVISDPALKKQIREAAEKEEHENYHGRMSEEWLEDLKKFGTDWNKPFLETVPCIIVVFRRIYEEVDGKKENNYYVNESVGLATGLLLTAIHNAGLCSLTHTPSPMNFLAKILNRPKNEKPFLLIPVGYPKDGAQVPKITRKGADEAIAYY